MKWEDINKYSGSTHSERVKNYLASNHEMVFAITRGKFLGNGEIFSVSKGTDLVTDFDSYKIDITGYSTTFREYFGDHEDKWKEIWTSNIMLDDFFTYIKNIKDGTDFRSRFLADILALRQR